MTLTQLTWAKTHDWFISERFPIIGNGYTITVRHDLEPTQTIEFDDYEELRVWAGY